MSERKKEWVCERERGRESESNKRVIVSNPDENILPVIATGRGNNIAADVRASKETRYGFLEVR